MHEREREREGVEMAMQDLEMAVQRLFTTGHGIPCPPESVTSACYPIESNEPLAPTAPSAQCTWKADTSVWVTLIKMAGNGTAIFLHGLNKIFSSASTACLKENCAAGSAFVGQVVVEHISGAPHLVIMLFDIVRHGVWTRYYC